MLFFELNGTHAYIGLLQVFNILSNKIIFSKYFFFIYRSKSFKKLCFCRFIERVAHSIGIDPMYHSRFFDRFAVAEGASEAVHAEVGKNFRHSVNVYAIHSENIYQ